LAACVPLTQDAWGRSCRGQQEGAGERICPAEAKCNWFSQTRASPDHSFPERQHKGMPSSHVTLEIHPITAPEYI